MAKPTINDVARIAGVSKKTVSRVINDSPLLNETTRTKVQRVIAELGYVPNPQARALALQRGGTSATAPSPITTGSAAGNSLIALIYDNGSLPFLAVAQSGALAALDGSEFALAVHALDGDAANMMEGLCAFIARHRPVGVLALPPLSENPAVAALCREADCRFVAIGARYDDNADLIGSEDRAAAAQAVSYLVSLGHERIAMVTGPDDSRIAQQRELGYLDAMADHELDRGPALIESGDHSFQSGYAAGQLLLEVSPRPSAIFAGNDEMAAGVIHAAAHSGIAVPDALSVMGFEDTPIAARLSPQLTSMRVPLAEMAFAATLRLRGAASAEPPTAFLPEVVIRASTAPAP